jgi:Domain of unknown function (DUF4345)
MLAFYDAQPNHLQLRSYFVEYNFYFESYIMTSSNTSYRTFQAIVAILAIIPLATGVLTMMGLSNPEYKAAGFPMHIVLDSNLRFYGGVWFGLGAVLLWMLPRLRTETKLFRAFSLMIFIGGIGRLLAMVFVGWPPVPFIAFTALEIIGMPLLVWWQSALSKDVTDKW